MRLLITGEHSFIGNALFDILADDHQIERWSFRNDVWKTRSFVGIESIMHVAGKAHVGYKDKDSESYYKVNRDLTLEVAKKAKEEGVKQFVFFSSMIVYGESYKKLQPISKDSKPNPTNAYAKSKLQAEEGLLLLEDESFRVVILRLPMVYGRHHKGNYSKLSTLAKKTPFFPKLNNQRSMLYLEDLVVLVKGIIEEQLKGYYYPQNQRVVSPSDMVKAIRQAHGKKTLLIPVIHHLLSFLMRYSTSLKKIVGNFYYDPTLSQCEVKYQNTSFEVSIAKTEGVAYHE